MNTKIYSLFILMNMLLIGMSTTYPTWEEYLDRFPEKRVKYESIPGEMERREARYNQVVATFPSITNFVPGVNQLTDQYEEQIKARSNLLEIPVTSRKPAPAIVKASQVGAPAEFDWRDRDAVTSVKNQGSCGSCWTFAAAGYAESRVIIAGDYNKNNIDLSEQYLLECTSYSSCTGGYMEYVMDTVKECPTESEYPYRPFSSYSGICSASGIRTGYDKFDYYNLQDDELIDLVLKGPVAISVASSGWSNYQGGVFQCSAGVSVDHAVLLVGYTADYWLIKNQWGESWGESGYIKIARGTNDCQVGRSAHILSETSMSSKFFFLVTLVLVMNFMF